MVQYCVDVCLCVSVCTVLNLDVESQSLTVVLIRFRKQYGDQGEKEKKDSKNYMQKN